MPTTEAVLVERVIDWVRANRQAGVADEVPITPDTDLLETGLLDSFGLLDLIAFIESHDGCAVALEDVDPGELAVVRGLCRLALGNGHASSR